MVKEVQVKEKEKLSSIAVLDDYFNYRDYKGEDIEYAVIPYTSRQEVIDALSAEKNLDYVIVSNSYPDAYQLSKDIAHTLRLTVMVIVEKKDVHTYRKALSYDVRGILTKPINLSKINEALENPLKEDPLRKEELEYIEETEPLPPHGEKIPRETVVSLKEAQEIKKEIKPGGMLRKKEERGKIITFYNAKGGVGKTLFSINTAVHMKKLYPNKKVALVDFDLDFGDTANFLKMEPKITALSWQYIPEDNLKETQVENYLMKHSTGIWVLPAPIPPIDENLFSYKVADKILSTLKQYFDLIIVDLGPTLRDTVVVTLEKTDYIYLVSTTNASSLRKAYDLVRIFDGLKIPQQKVGLILNAARKNLDLSEIKKYIPYPVVLRVPDIQQVRELHDNYSLSIQDKRLRVYLEDLAYHITGKQPPKKGLFAFFKRGEHS